MLPSFFCVIISIGDDMKIIKKLLVIAFLCLLHGCQDKNNVQFIDGIELCNENGIMIKIEEIVNCKEEKQVFLDLVIENENLKEAYISFDEIKVNGLITQEINEAQYIYLGSGNKEKKIVSIDYSDIASLGINSITDIANIEMTITSSMAKMPNINYLTKNVTIYPFGIEKQLDMHDKLEPYKTYENENLAIYYLGYEDGELKLYIKNKMLEDIAMDMIFKDLDDEDLDDDSKITYTFIGESADILVKVPLDIFEKIECSFDVYHSEFFRQEDPLMKDSFIIEMGNDRS